MVPSCFPVLPSVTLPPLDFSSRPAHPQPSHELPTPCPISTLRRVQRLRRHHLSTCPAHPPHPNGPQFPLRFSAGTATPSSPCETPRTSDNAHPCRTAPSPERHPPETRTLPLP